MESGGTEIPCGGVSKTPLGAKPASAKAKIAMVVHAAG